MPATRKLYFCEYDLTYFISREQLMRHLQKVRVQHPPGIEIYRNNGVSMWEVDGDESNAFCRNLCSLAKMFLDHKSVDCCINDFMFYVMTEVDERGAHVCGYFSKEKNPQRKNNLSCILCIPAYQRRGYGKFLVSFSYELSKIEKKAGTPEKPLSDMGQVTYESHWARAICGILKNYEGPLSVKNISDMTMFTESDIIDTLKRLDLIRYAKGQPVLSAPLDALDEHLRKAGSAGCRLILGKSYGPRIPAKLASQAGSRPTRPSAMRLNPVRRAAGELERDQPAKTAAWSGIFVAKLIRNEHRFD